MNQDDNAPPTWSRAVERQRHRTLARAIVALDPGSPTFAAELAAARELALSVIEERALPRGGSPMNALSRAAGTASKNRKLEEHRQLVVGAVADLRAAEPGASAARLAETLNDMGVRTFVGRRWTSGNLRACLRPRGSRRGSEA